MMASNAGKTSVLMQTVGVRRYLLVCILALFGMLMALLAKDLGEWSLLPVALGCIILLLQLRFGPPLIMVLITAMLLWLDRTVDPLPLVITVLSGGTSYREDALGPTFADLILTTSLLVYTIGFYRIRAIVIHVLPLDSRRKQFFSKELGRTDYQEKRNPEGIQTWETAQVPLTSLAWSCLGTGLWIWVGKQAPWWGFSPASWKALLLLWILGLGLMITTAVLSYLDNCLAGPMANRIALQDQLWLATRREQTQIHRWLTRLRLTNQRRKEQS